MSFTKLDKELKKSIKKKGIKGQLDSTEFMSQLKDAGELIFGEQTMKKIKPLECKNGILTISCTSSVLAKKLKARENSILWQLNKSFGKRVVERLKFLV